MITLVQFNNGPGKLATWVRIDSNAPSVRDGATLEEMIQRSVRRYGRVDLWNIIESKQQQETEAA